MEGKINMAARRQVTNKLQVQYRKAAKADKGEILDRVVATTGMGRSTARRTLTGPRLSDPGEQVDGRRLRPRGFSDDAKALLEHVWALMGMLRGKYLTVMLESWLPLKFPGFCSDLHRRIGSYASSVSAGVPAACVAGRDRSCAVGPHLRAMDH